MELTNEIKRLFEEEERLLEESHKRTVERHNEIMESIGRAACKQNCSTEIKKIDYELCRRIVAMSAKDDLFKLDEVVMAIYCAHKKVQIMSDDLSQECFDITEEERKYVDYDRAGIKNWIASDYIHEMKKLIDMAQELINRAYDTLNQEEV